MQLIKNWVRVLVRKWQARRQWPKAVATRRPSMSNVCFFASLEMRMLLDGDVIFGFPDEWSNPNEIFTDSGDEPEIGYISGIKWNDLNGDGIQNEGEAGVAGVTTYIDLNDNGQLDQSEARIQTGPDGSYTFSGLLPGDYVVREILSAGFVQTFPGTSIRTVGTTFESRGNIEAETIAVGDINGDGYVDIVVAGNDRQDNHDEDVGVISLFVNNGGGLFAAGTTLLIEDGADAVSLGDIDGDGDLDLAVADDSYGDVPGTINLFYNNGLGLFTGDEKFQVEDVDAIAFGDIDGDGDVDLAVAGDHYDSSLADNLGVVNLFVNNGGGIFAAVPKVEVEAGAHAVAFGDVDGDGDLDLAVAVDSYGDDTPGTICLFYNNGFGLFATGPMFLVEDGADAVSFGDIDGDGDLDLAVADDSYGDAPGAINLFYNNGFGLFAYGASLQIEDVDAAVFGDVDGDGDTDLVVADDGYGDNDPGKISLFLNSGVPALLPGPTFQFDVVNIDGIVINHESQPVFDIDIQVDPEDVHAVAFGDIDGDGDLDLAVAADSYYPYDPDTVSLFLNNGSGFFTPGPTVLVDTLDGSQNAVVEFGDIDGDGDVDLAVAVDPYGSYEPGRISIFLNDGGGLFTPGATVVVGEFDTVAFGDIDGDGNVDLALADDSNGDEGPSTISLFLNNGYGAFVPGPMFQVGDVDAVAFGDVDGDNDLDLAVVGSEYAGDQHTGAISLFLNNGGGVFTVTPALLVKDVDSEDGVSVAFGDIDQDGDVDLAMAVHSEAYADDPGTISLFLNNGSGVFTEGPTVVAEHDTKAIAFGDIDGDGDIDLAMVGDAFVETGRYRVMISLFLAHDGGAFTPGQTFQGQGETNGHIDMAVGDIDGDGDLDLALAGNVNYDDGIITLFVNNGFGLFTPGPTFQVEDLGAVAFGDVDGDNDLDLVVAGNGYDDDGTDGTIALFLNNGSGLLSPGPTVLVGASDAVALGDIDGDGDVDLAVADDIAYEGGTISLFVNSGGGLFTAGPTVQVEYGAEAIAFGDIDDDGDVDLAVAGDTYDGSQGKDIGTVEFFVNNGGGLFTSGSTVEVEDKLEAVAFGDIDGDGDIDLMLTDDSYNPDDDSSRIHLFLNNGVGAFTPGATIRSDAGSEAIALGDIDSDGDIDLALAGDHYVHGQNANIGTVEIILNNDGGVFTARPTVEVDYSPQAVAAGDIDGDGDVDLAVSERGYDNDGDWLATVSLLVNDGVAGFTPGLVVLVDAAEGNYEGGVAFGDVDGDGDIDLAVSGTGYDDGGDWTSTVSLFVNDGVGAFAPGPAVVVDTPAGKDNGTVAFGDVDGDNDVDLALVGEGYDGDGYEIGTVSLFVNDGMGVFTPGSTVVFDTSGDDRRATIAFGDIDDDGDVDLAVADDSDNADYGPSRIRLFLNDGFGAFTPETTVLVGIDAEAIAFGDIDDDGDVDLAVAGDTYDSSQGKYVGTVSVFVNNGGGLFTSGPTVEVEGSVAAVVFGDIDDDGDVDLTVVGDTYDDSQGKIVGTVTILINDNGGALTNVPTFERIEGMVEAVAFGDIDGDGDVDLVVTGDHYGVDRHPGEVSLFINNGGGVFTAMLTFSAEYGGDAVALGDIDGDGDVDLAVAGDTYDGSGSKAIGTVGVFVNNGGGLFTSGSTVEVEGSAAAVVSGDIDGDGDLDLAVVGNGYDDDGVWLATVSLFLNNGFGLFAGGPTFTVGEGFEAVASGDIDGDGDLDLVVAGNEYNDDGYVIGTISLFVNNGVGVFAAGPTFIIEDGVEAVASGDIDGDGDLDLVVAGNGYNDDGYEIGTISLFANNGSGVFSTGPSFLVEDKNAAVAFGDIDGDGDLDLAVTHDRDYDNPSKISIFINDGGHALTLSSGDQLIDRDFGNRIEFAPNLDPPRVTGVVLTSTAWNSVFLDQLEAEGSGGARGYAIPVGNSAQFNAIGWSGVDQIIIRFSEEVNVDQSDLGLVGVLGPDGAEDASDDYSFNAFATETGPSGEFQAVWTLSTPLGIDKLLMKLDGTTSKAVTDLVGNKLDGEWTDGVTTYPSGNGLKSADFSFRFNVLPGDVNQNGTVEGGDLSMLLGSWLQSVPPVHPLTDITGDTQVGGGDLSVVLGNWLRGLPNGTPTNSANGGVTIAALLGTSDGAGSLGRFGLGSVSQWRSDRGGPATVLQDDDDSVDLLSTMGGRTIMVDTAKSLAI